MKRMFYSSKAPVKK